jgi:hypothetical protein
MRWWRRGGLIRGFVLRICRSELLDHCLRYDMAFLLIFCKRVRGRRFQINFACTRESSDALEGHTVTNVLDDLALHKGWSKFAQPKQFGRRNQIWCVTCGDQQSITFV